MDSSALNRIAISFSNGVTGFSVVVIKHHDQKLLTEDCVYFGLQFQRDKNLYRVGEGRAQAADLGSGAGS